MSQNMSEAEVTALKELLQRCRAAGCLNRVFGELGEDVGELFEEQFDEVQGHVIVQMSDASKRRLSPETFSRSCRATNQMPVMPAAKAQAQASSRVEEFSLDPANIPFPDDVVDMKDWGTTIMQTGKFAGSKMTYLELYDSKDPEVKKYLIWLMKAVRPNYAPQFQDLVNYLQKMEYGLTKTAFTRVRKTD